MAFSPITASMVYSPQEEYIVKLLRSLSPYEKIVITADKDGIINRFLIQREQKILITEKIIRNVA
jgi:hypothetical protein